MTAIFWLFLPPLLEKRRHRYWIAWHHYHLPTPCTPMVDGDKKFRFRNALPCNCKEALMIRVSTPYGQVCDITYWHALSDNHNKYIQPNGWSIVHFSVSSSKLPDFHTFFIPAPGSFLEYSRNLSPPQSCSYWSYRITWQWWLFDTLRKSIVFNPTSSDFDVLLSFSYSYS